MCQYRLDFQSFDTQVVAGDGTCAGGVGDAFTVTTPAAVQPPALCGFNTGQHCKVPLNKKCFIWFLTCLFICWFQCTWTRAPRAQRPPPRRWTLLTALRSGTGPGMSKSLRFLVDHWQSKLEIAVTVRSLKSSNVVLGYYLDGRLSFKCFPDYCC